VVFRDRSEAGRLLAEKLSGLKGRDDVIVLAVPRGGVVVGYEITKALSVPLDVYITRKIGAPHNPELAIGAVSSDGGVLLDDRLIRQLGVSADYVEREKDWQLQEIERRLQEYRGERPEPSLDGKHVILADDGVATGSTVLVTIRSLKSNHLKKLTLAVPVGPPETIARLAMEADEVVCLATPEPFWAVGRFYLAFDQTSDEEVKRLLAQAKRFGEQAAPSSS